MIAAGNKVIFMSEKRELSPCRGIERKRDCRGKKKSTLDSCVSCKKNTVINLISGLATTTEWIFQSQLERKELEKAAELVYNKMPENNHELVHGSSYSAIADRSLAPSSSTKNLHLFPTPFLRLSILVSHGSFSVITR